MLDDLASTKGEQYNEGEWTEQTKLTASDAASYDYFGNAVAINGDYRS